MSRTLREVGSDSREFLPEMCSWQSCRSWIKRLHDHPMRAVAGNLFPALGAFERENISSKRIVMGSLEVHLASAQGLGAR
jgi:hypothetical protein